MNTDFLILHIKKNERMVLKWRETSKLVFSGYKTIWQCWRSTFISTISIPCTRGVDPLPNQILIFLPIRFHPSIFPSIFKCDPWTDKNHKRIKRNVREKYRGLSFLTTSKERSIKTIINKPVIYNNQSDRWHFICKK